MLFSCNPECLLFAHSGHPPIGFWPSGATGTIREKSKKSEKIEPQGGVIIALGVGEQRFLRFGRRLQMVEGDAMGIEV